MTTHNFSAFFRQFLCVSFLLTLTFSSTAQELELDGIGAYNEFNNTSLVMRLDSIAPGIEPSEPDPSSITNRFSFRIIEPKTPRRWGQFWSQSLSLNNSVASVTEHFQNLISMTEAVKDTLETGDLLAFELQRDNALVMRLNGIELTRFSDSGFYDFLLSAVIGRIPPSSALKAQLLGEDTSEVDMHLALFESFAYEESRVASINNWIAPVIQPTPEPVAVNPAQADATALPVDQNPASTSTAEEPNDIDIAAEIAAREEAERLAAEQEAAALAAAAAEAARAEEAARNASLELIIANQQHIQSVLRKVYANIEYPKSAVRQGREGVARIAITLNRNGSLNRVELVEESNYDDLNEAALASVETAAPFDPAPQANEDDQTFIQFPIRFQLSD